MERKSPFEISMPVVSKIACDAFHEYVAGEIDNGGLEKDYKTTMKYNQ